MNVVDKDLIWILQESYHENTLQTVGNIIVNDS